MTRSIAPLEFVVVFWARMLMIQTNAAPECPAGWSAYEADRKCLKYVDYRHTFLQAKGICKTQCSGLVKIYDDAKQDFILDEMGVEGPVYIGVHSLDRGDTFSYINGSELSYYAPWQTGQPDNQGGDEFCVQLLGEQDRNWKDIRCTTQLPFVCEKGFSPNDQSSVGTIKSHDYPNRYGKYRRDEWDISVPGGNFITFRFEQPFWIQSCCDYLEITDSSDSNSPCVTWKYKMKHTGSSIPHEYTSMTNKIYLRFYSDGQTGGSGFLLKWKKIKLTCRGVLYDPAGSIKSPHYPDDYDNNSDCRWVIFMPPGYSVRLTFHSPFRLQESKDFVRIFDVDQMGNRQTRREYSGNIVPSEYTSTTHQVEITFTSDDSGVGAGLHVTWEKVGCPEGWRWYKEDQKCLKHFYESQTFDQARDTCYGQDSDLVQIRDDDLRDFIYYEMGKNGRMWIGVHSLKRDGIFEYVDGSGLTHYTPWALNQTDLRSDRNQTKLCVHLTERALGQWRISNCNETMRFVCDKNAEPERIEKNVENDELFIVYITVMMFVCFVLGVFLGVLTTRAYIKRNTNKTPIGHHNKRGATDESRDLASTGMSDEDRYGASTKASVMIMKPLSSSERSTEDHHLFHSLDSQDDNDFGLADIDIMSTQRARPRRNVLQSTTVL